MTRSAPFDSLQNVRVPLQSTQPLIEAESGGGPALETGSRAELAWRARGRVVERGAEHRRPEQTARGWPRARVTGHPRKRVLSGVGQIPFLFPWAPPVCSRCYFVTMCAA